MMTYLELRRAIRDRCADPEIHDLEVARTAACSLCGWYGAMSLQTMNQMVETRQPHRRALEPTAFLNPVAV